MDHQKWGWTKKNDDWSGKQRTTSHGTQPMKARWALLWITLRFIHRNGCKCIVTMYFCVYIYIYIHYTDIYIYIYYTSLDIYIYICIYVYRYSPFKSSWLITFCHSIVMAFSSHSSFHGSCHRFRSRPNNVNIQLLQNGLPLNCELSNYTVSIQLWMSYLIIADETTWCIIFAVACNSNPQKRCGKVASSRVLSRLYPWLKGGFCRLHPLITRVVSYKIL